MIRVTLAVLLLALAVGCGASPPPAATTSTDEDRDRDPPKVGTDIDPPTAVDGGARDGGGLDAVPAPKATPDAARVSSSGASQVSPDECAVLVDRVIALIAKELGETGPELAKMRDQLIAQCRAKPPTAEESRCLANAATLEDLSKCTGKAGQRKDVGLP